MSEMLVFRLACAEKGADYKGFAILFKFGSP
jgi:hypothetical protein